MLIVYKNRDFLLMLSGKFISLLGNSIHRIGLTWYILSIYGDNSGKILSLVLIASILPTAILGSVLGSIVDRYNKKIIVVVADLVSGLIVFLLSWLLINNLLSLPTLIIVTAILSINSSLVTISINSMIPEILTSEELFQANSNSQLIDRITILFGLSLGGILVGLLGIYRVFIFNGASFIISAFMESLIRYMKNKNDKDSTLKMEKSSFIIDLKYVVAYLKENKKITRLILNFTLVNFLWDPIFNIVFPYLLKNDFNVTPIEFGFIQSALPLGFCIGAIYFSKRDSFLKKDSVLFNSIFRANTLFSFITVTFLFAPLLSYSKWIIYYTGIILIVTGIYSASINISIATNLQQNIPNNLRGKILGILTSFATGLIPLGGVLVGIFLGKITSSLFFLISCIGVFCVLFFQPKRVFLLTQKN